jgi:CRP-like cAMP-binding protein
LIAAIPHRQVELPSRRLYREPNSAADEAIFVKAGVLAKFRVQAPDRKQIVSLRFAGEGILPRAQPMTHGVQAIVPTHILVIRKVEFDRALLSFPELSSLCLRETQRQAAIGQEWLINCGSRDSTTRVAHFLCELAVRSGTARSKGSFPNPFTQLQIGQITGQTSVNVNRVLGELERSGLMLRQGREIRIHDWSEFSRVAQFDAAYLT